MRSFAQETSPAAAGEAPRHAGMLVGLQAGVAGLVRLPKEGLRNEGLRGMVKGSVRGAIGFVVLPTSGFFNQASRTTSSMRNLVNPAPEMVQPTHVTTRAHAHARRCSIYTHIYTYT